MEQNEEMRVIAVGDDDQNIFEFRGAHSKYLGMLLQAKEAVKHELVENYRSKNNLVEFSNQFAKRIRNRLKDTPVIARQADNGSVKIVRYQSDNLIVPLVNDILATRLTGTTCVLTRTNEEALQITGLLLKNKMPAKLIQSNDGFYLSHLAEVRYFVSQLNLADDVYIIPDEVWESAKQALHNEYRRSNKLEICLNIIRDFEATNPKKKYKSDLDMFIRESKLEDFMGESGETVLVSTIHKAKGKEFDHVFLMLDNFMPDTDDEKRLLYVAMTRAKQRLTIHLNSNLLDNFRPVENMERLVDSGDYNQPAEIAMQLTHRDVWLGYFVRKQSTVSQLMSGDSLILNDEGCSDSKRQPVLKFSNRLLKQLESMKSANYVMKSAKVNFIVYWLDEETQQEVKIVLPELWFEKQG
jgi:ATP-dependent DNA helicase RecQ